MPFTVQQIADAAKVGLDFYMKNKPPVDQIAVDRPLLKFLKQYQSEFPGAKQYVTEQLRKDYGSNFQFYRGSGQVTYNERQSIEQTQFPWCSAHDGYMIDEDRLSQNGIIVNDDRTATASDAEVIQLTNLLKEQNEILDLGFEEKFSAYLHLDGTSATDAIVGLDALVTLSADPTAAAQQVMGGLDRFTFPWWRNQKATGLSSSTVVNAMEVNYRNTAKYNGKPTMFLCGGDFIDAFRANALASSGGIIRYQTPPSKGGMALDPSVTDLHFHGVPLVYSPEFDNNFGGLGGSPSIPWSKRCYGLDKNHIRLRPLQGQNMVSRKPPRPHDRYVTYAALTWKGAMTVNKARAHQAYSLT